MRNTKILLALHQQILNFIGAKIAEKDTTYRAALPG
jgi:hypothetical protein